eukprot:6361736-Alexandrium_andersonii.AAC.1
MGNDVGNACGDLGDLGTDWPFWRAGVVQAGLRRGRPRRWGVGRRARWAVACRRSRPEAVWTRRRAVVGSRQ